MHALASGGPGPEESAGIGGKRKDYVARMKAKLEAEVEVEGTVIMGELDELRKEKVQTKRDGELGKWAKDGFYESLEVRYITNNVQNSFWNGSKAGLDLGILRNIGIGKGGLAWKRGRKSPFAPP